MFGGVARFGPGVAHPPYSSALEALGLAGIALWCFATALAGGVAGLVLGNLRLPVIVFAASSPAAGAGANIGISAIAAATAGIAHGRAGRIDWRLVARLAPPSVAGAIAGSAASAGLPGNVLLGVIGVALIGFGLDLLRPRRPAEDSSGVRHRTLGLVAAAGLIGFLGGVVGLILGSLRLPALLRIGNVDALRAVGTNLVVGVCVGVAGVAAHAPAGVDWNLLTVGAASSIPGALIGARLAGRLDEVVLLRVVGLLLVVAGAAALGQGAL